MPRGLFRSGALALALVALSRPAPADEPKKYPDFAAFVQGAKVHEGLITLHQKDDHVYAELTPAHFERNFLLPIAVAKGAGIGGATLNFGDQWVVLFRKAGDKVFVVRRNTRFTARPGTPTARAVDTSYGDSVLAALPVRTVNPAKASVVVDLNQVFFTDFAELKLGFLDRERTTWERVKAFKNNVELRVQATYQGRPAGDGVIDSRGVTVSVQYGLVLLPDGFAPRHADDRVGHFLTVRKDFSQDGSDSAFVRYVNRWRLERADGMPWKEGGKLSPPKKKIVFWIENTVPDEYRAAVREGILEWNKAFEKIGFRDAIEVRQQEGEEFDPEDVSYATFRWVAHDEGYADGPSRVNPLTGEILDADIRFDGSMVRFTKREQRLFRSETGALIDPASPMQAAARGWGVPRDVLSLRGYPDGWNDPARRVVEPPGEAAALALIRHRAGLCECASHRSGELAAAYADAVLRAGGKDAAATDAILQQAVKDTTMHEVGHTLGLRHNFKASGMLPNDKLHDTDVTRKKGLLGSVMDYAPANIAPPGAKQGDYFTTTLGPYDYWAVEYAYRPTGGGSDGERDELGKIAAKGAGDPDLAYGTDEDLFLSPDPLINQWDLGSDTLRFARDRVKLAEACLPKIADAVVDTGEGYQRARAAFRLMLNQYGNAALLASKAVGGLSVRRDHKGDAGGKDPVTPVPAETRREALKLLREVVLTDAPFRFPPELLRKLGPDRWVHWGNDDESVRNVDFPLNERILAIQSVALRELFDADTLSRIQNGAASAPAGEKPFTLGELFAGLTDAVFADLGKDDAATPVRRNLQRAYLLQLAATMMGRSTAPSPRPVPGDTRSLARLHLRRLDERLGAALARNPKDDEVRAHLEDLQERARRALAPTVTTAEP